ncbi:hypothetical protein TSAR_005022 [Trichomalopsis sarcophagae]|uniref:Uncharacterized protein n=1 Tax=Trichomalopsis sarcophagae TaxID=543379 RepID=A0A232FBH2_9HYME|nr:hypothetical protein TSAR_005022 [Trichomalopsis sarcophagae]
MREKRRLRGEYRHYYTGSRGRGLLVAFFEDEHSSDFMLRVAQLMAYPKRGMIPELCHFSYIGGDDLWSLLISQDMLSRFAAQFSSGITSYADLYLKE